MLGERPRSVRQRLCTFEGCQKNYNRNAGYSMRMCKYHIRLAEFAEVSAKLDNVLKDLVTRCNIVPENLYTSTEHLRNFRGQYSLRESGGMGTVWSVKFAHVPWKHSCIKVRGVEREARPAFLDKVVFKSRLAILTPAQMRTRFRLVIVFEISQDIPTVQLVCRRFGNATHGNVLEMMSQEDWSSLVEHADYRSCVESIDGCTDVFEVIKVPPPRIVLPSSGARSLPVIESCAWFGMHDHIARSDSLGIMSMFKTRETAALTTWRFFSMANRLAELFEDGDAILARYINLGGVPEAFRIQHKMSAVRYHIEIRVERSLLDASIIGSLVQLTNSKGGSSHPDKSEVLRIVPSVEYSSLVSGGIQCDEKHCGYALFGLSAIDTEPGKSTLKCALYLRSSRSSEEYKRFVLDSEDGYAEFREWFKRWIADHLHEEELHEAQLAKKPRTALSSINISI